ncbi:MAG: MarR family transcriptional regulator [Bacteroidota bacterium]|nr:MarR family transcriptional regulator [Bacteroidota bacterium]
MDELLLNDKELLFGVISGKVSTAINRKLYHDFRANDITLTPEQWVVLQSLAFKDGITQQELATFTFKDKPSITRLLDNLEKHSLIARLADKLDKRSNLIHITKAGIAMHQRAKAIVLNSMKEALNGLSEEDIRTGEHLLKKIFKNLS